MQSSISMCTSNISACVQPHGSSLVLSLLSLVVSPQSCVTSSHFVSLACFHGNYLLLQTKLLPIDLHNSLIQISEQHGFTFDTQDGGNLAERSKRLSSKNRKSNQLLDFLVQQREQNLQSWFTQNYSKIRNRRLLLFRLVLQILRNIHNNTHLLAHVAC